MVSPIEKLRIVTPMIHLWRDDADVAQTALQAQTGNGISIFRDRVNLDDGDWVAYDSDHKVDKVGATSVPNVFVVFRAALENSDNTAVHKVTLVKGQFEAYSRTFDDGATYANGSELTAKNGQLELAGSGDYVVGHAYGPDANGELHFHTYQGGYVKA